MPVDIKNTIRLGGPASDTDESESYLNINMSWRDYICTQGPCAQGQGKGTAKLETPFASSGYSSKA